MGSEYCGVSGGSAAQTTVRNWQNPPAKRIIHEQNAVGIEYAANNRVSRARDSATGNIWKTYGHDARGNVTSNADLSFVYDLSNQPVSMSGDASGTYAYDGNYKRVKQTINGESPSGLFRFYLIHWIK